MTGPPLDRCTRFQPTIMCASRRDAIRAGEMFFSSHHGGWIYPAEGRAVPRGLIREHKPPAIFTFCPFCSGALPDEISAVERLILGEGDE